MQQHRWNYSKKLDSGESNQSKDTPMSFKDTIIIFKRNVVEAFGWSLYEIDETELGNLIAFATFSPTKDPNVRVIQGKTYKRSDGPPSWL